MNEKSSADNTNSATITSVGASKTVTISQVIAASKVVVNYVNTYKKLPTTITVGSNSLTQAQFSCLVMYSISSLNAGKPVSTALTVPVYGASTTTGDNINVSANPVTYAKAVLTYLSTNKILPGTVQISGKKAQFNVYTYAFANTLVSYSTNNKLPATVLFSSSVYNGTPTPTPTVANVTVKQVMDAANSVVTYVTSNKALPSTVTVGSTTVSIAQFSYLEAMAVQYLNAGKSINTQINIINVSGNTATYSILKNPTQSAYVTAAKTVATSMSSNKVAPAYVTVSSANADFRVYTHAFAKILVWYKTYNRLPNTCTFDSSVFNNSSPTPTPTSSFTIAQIMAAAINLRDYVDAHKALPSTVTVGSTSLSTAQFSYLEAMAVQYLNAGKSSSTKIAVINVTGNSATYSILKNPAQSAYVTAAKTVATSMSSNKVAPAYVTVSSANADFRVYTYAFAKILAFYKTNNRLPNTCTFNSSVFNNSSPTPTPTSSFTIAQIMAAAVNLKNYVDTNKVLPSTVTVGSTKLSTAEFSYLETMAIQYLNAKKSTATKIAVIEVTDKSDTYSINKTAALSAYVAAAKSVATSMSSNKVAPAYVTISSAKADYRVYTYAFAKILAFYKTNNRLPSTCAFDSSVFSSSPSPIPGNITYKKGVNELANETDLSKYLIIKDRCAVNDAITQLAKDLTKNCKSDLEKATAIFNYVRNNIGYSYYYNSKYNATGTLTYKTANCCDHSNLLVALYRSAGLACRYSHAKCTFNSGLNVGHVWVQVYIKEPGETGVWLCADATSSQNSLGYINNWKLSSMTNLNQYNLLPF